VFEWDIKKARINFNKHNLSFEEACSVFFDPRALDGADITHSKSEPRFIRIGQTISTAVIVVVYTWRIKNEVQKIRIISARKASKKERESYFKED